MVEELLSMSALNCVMNDLFQLHQYASFLKDVIKSDIFRYEIHYALTRISDNCCQKRKRSEM